MELNFERRMAGLAGLAVGREPQDHKYDPDLERVRGKVRSTIAYPDGGSYTTWITDGSSASDWDEEKENRDPLSSYPQTSSGPSCKPQHRKFFTSSHNAKSPFVPTSTSASNPTPLTSQPSVEI